MGIPEIPSLSINISQEQIFITAEGKMRNHLAVNVLECQMLHLMEEYKKSLGEGGKIRGHHSVAEMHMCFDNRLQGSNASIISSRMNIDVV